MGIVNSSTTTRELIKNTGIIAIGNISTRAVSFLLLPLYTNILSVDEYGLIDILSTYVTFICVIVGMQLNSSIFRFVIPYRDDLQKLREICSTAFFLQVSLCFIYVIIFLSVYNFLDIEYKWFLLLHVISTTIFQFMSGLVRGLGNNKLYSITNFMSSIVTIYLNVLLLLTFHLGVAAMLSSYLIGSALGIIILFLYGNVFNKLSINAISLDVSKSMLSFSIPLIPNELSWSVLHTSDRVIVTTFLGVAANGIIAVSSKISSIYTTFFSFFNSSWTEQVVLHYKDEGGTDYIAKMFNTVILMFGGLAIFITSIIPFFYSILIPNPEYIDAFKLIPLYILAVFFNAIIGLISAIYLVENETKLIAITTTTAAIINIASNLLLINYLGVYAAPISSICGYAVISFWRFFDVNKRYCRIYVDKVKAGLMCLSFLLSLIEYWLDDFFLKIIIFLIIIFFILKINSSVLLYAKKYLNNDKS